MITPFCNLAQFYHKIQNQDYPYRKWILLSFSIIITSASAGLVFGWPAFRRILLQNDKSALSEKELSVIFTVTAWANQGSVFFFGLSRDRFGTKWTASISILTVAVGLLGIAFCDANDTYGLTISLSLVGLGSGVQLAVQPVAELFPKRRGTILSSVSGTFQVSALMFLALSWISTDRSIIFTGLAILMCIFLVIAVLILPHGSSFVLKESEYSQSTSSTSLKYQNKDIESAVSIRSKSSSSEILGKPIKSEESVITQIKTLEFILLTVWFSACVTGLQYYIGSIGFQLERKGDDTGFYTNLQQIIYSALAIISPLIGLFADKCGLGVVQGIGTLLCAFAFYILALDSISLNVHVLGLICYGAGRMIVYSMFFSNVGKRFELKNFGTLSGLGMVISAIFSLIQYPLIALADDGKERTVNLICGALFTLILPYCVWLYKIERNFDEKNLKYSEKQIMPS